MSDNQIKDGISLRTIHLWMIIGAVILAGLMFFATYNLSVSFRELTETAEQQIELRNAANELMKASDFLTEKVQRFTVEGDRTFMDEYFYEATEARHREEAIALMAKDEASASALEQLEQAMEGSVGLMNREYYAMRLVVEAKGITDYPDEVAAVKLSAEDQALSSDEKMHRATEMVLDDQYYQEKDVIREKIQESLDELEKMAYATDASALRELHDEIVFVRIVIVLMAIAIIFMVWLTSRLGIHPVLKAVERIKADSPIPEIGANEFRYLARTYNRMYDVYKDSLAHLNFKASHDQLTGAYNRSGYDLLLTSVDMTSTYMMLFDIDNFKSINDTYGHETGDQILIKVVTVLKNNFRTDDYVCRIGGDEFVVFMIHTTVQQQGLISAKIGQINRELSDIKDGLPETSVSVGIVHGSQAADPGKIFEKADEAMYQSKQRGKSTFTFYSE